MKFLVPGANVKVLGKAIHCLAKVGDEVSFETESESLCLRTVNISRWEWIMFCYQPAPTLYNLSLGLPLHHLPSAKHSFQVLKVTTKSRSARWHVLIIFQNIFFIVCIQVMIRSLLLAFKSLSFLEKTVDNCIIEIDAQNCKLLINFGCRYSAIFSLTFYAIN